MFDKDIQTSIELGVDLMKDIVAAGYSFLKEKNKERDFFGVATKKYVGGLIERYNNVKVLGMREPVPLKSLYVRANILEKISAEHRGVRLEDLEKSFDRDRRTFGKTTEPVDGEAIANRLQKFIVLGKPGAGKTTYLRFLTLMMLDPASGIKHRRLPIFVTLHDWAQKAVPLMDYLIEQFSISGFEEAQPFVERMLKDGNCLVLFDGLDEVNQEADQDGIVSQIRDFTNKFRENQFIISCRVVAFSTNFEHFIDVEIADFNDEQIETFIRNWFQGQPKAASECWERLKANPQLRELASVPLLLTLICLAYNPDKGGFPQKRSSIYRDAIKVLLEQWDESRPGGRVKRDEIYKNLSRQNKEAMFARIAWGMFTENQYFIEEEKLARMIQNFIKSLPEYQDEKALPDGERILKQIEAQHGILVERAKGVCSFLHLTLQEYFTAKFIVGNSINGMIEKMIEEYLHESKWEEVFSSMAEMLDSTEELLLLILNKNRKLTSNEQINNVLKSAIIFLNSFEEEVPENCGMCVIHANVLSGRSLAKFSQLNQGRFREGGLFGIHHIVYNFEFSMLLVMVDFRFLKDSVLAFYHFMNANNLLVSILNSSSYISKPIREKILNEMLMPRREEE